MTEKKIQINRAPVLTLWAAVVAERSGHGAQEALTLGRALAGLNAQSKGRRLGIYEEKEPKAKSPEGRAKPGPKHGFGAPHGPRDSHREDAPWTARRRRG